MVIKVTTSSDYYRAVCLMFNVITKSKLSIKLLVETNRNKLRNSFNS